MKIKFNELLIISLILISMSSCKNHTSIENSEVTSSITSSITELSQIEKQRDQTAFNAFQLAYVRAKEWDQSALLYEIPSTVLISENINLVTPGSHWFFMFKTPDSPRELYVAVSNNSISGTLQAQPLSIGNAPYKKLPIEINSLIDSNEALRLCVQENFITPEEILNSNQIIDYRLINLSGNPVWSIYLSEADPYMPICNIDANSGDLTNDPFANYID